MERKEYFRYTKPLEPYEAECAKKMDVIELSFKVGRIIDHGKHGLEMRVDRGYVWFEFDEVIRAAKQNLDMKDNVTIKYIKEEGKCKVVSFDNHNTNICVTNKRLQRIWDYQKKIEEMHKEAYNMLYPLLKDTACTAMILRKNTSGYELVDIRTFQHSGVVGGLINQFLMDNAFDIMFKDRVEVLSYVDAIIEDIPNSNCVLYLCNHRVKRHDCRCGESSISNRSLLVPTNCYTYDYLCAHCFFEKMCIFVPDDFKKEFSVNQHIVNNPPRFVDVSIAEILCG